MKKLMIFSLLCAAPIFAQTPVTTCTGMIQPTVITGDLDVPAGKTCTLFSTPYGNIVEVQGNVTVQGTLVSNGTHFLKNVTANGGAISFRYDFGNQIPTIVDGDVLITNSNNFSAITKGTVNAQPQVKGNLTVTGNGTDPDGWFGFTAFGVVVGGNMAVSNNNAKTPIFLYENVVGKNLNCGGNNPAPTNIGNTAGQHKNGQCK